MGWGRRGDGWMAAARDVPSVVPRHVAGSAAAPPAAAAGAAAASWARDRAERRALGRVDAGAECEMEAAPGWAVRDDDELGPGERRALGACLTVRGGPWRLVCCEVRGGFREAVHVRGRFGDVSLDRCLLGDAPQIGPNDPFVHTVYTMQEPVSRIKIPWTGIRRKVEGAVGSEQGRLRLRGCLLEDSLVTGVRLTDMSTAIVDNCTFTCWLVGLEARDRCRLVVDRSRFHATLTAAALAENVTALLEGCLFVHDHVALAMTGASTASVRSCVVDRPIDAAWHCDRLSCETQSLELVNNTVVCSRGRRPRDYELGAEEVDWSTDADEDERPVLISHYEFLNGDDDDDDDYGFGGGREMEKGQEEALERSRGNRPASSSKRRNKSEGGEHVLAERRVDAEEASEFYQTYRDSLVARPWHGRFRPRRLVEQGTRVQGLPSGVDAERLAELCSFQTMEELNDSVLRDAERMAGPMPLSPEMFIRREDLEREYLLVRNAEELGAWQEAEEQGRVGPARPTGRRHQYAA